MQLPFQAVSCLQKLENLRENKLTLPHKSGCTTAANSGEIREIHTPIVKSRWFSISRKFY